MRTFFAIILLFVSVGLTGQTATDQEVFKGKIWKVVKVSDNEHTFFDQNNKLLGRRIRKGGNFVYQDKWKRNLRTIKVPGAPKKVTITNKVAKKTEQTPSKRDARRAGQTIVRNNRATFYNAQGDPYRSARRRNNRVFFHDEKGSLIGYKIYHKNGSKVYKDPKGRTTGRSHINKTGKMIYKAKNRRRQTPRIMFEDPFLFSR